MGDVERNSLEFWCGKIVNDPDLLPYHRIENGKGILVTHCNIAVHRICRGMDYHNLEDKLANDIRDYCAKNWITPHGEHKDKMLSAYNAGLLGDLAILAYSDKPHGHVVVVAPRKPMLYSGKWGLYVPQVANVGGFRKDGTPNCGIMGASYAFHEIPEVYILGKTII